MILSKSTGYGIRALAYLAARTPDSPCTLQEIADHEDIPALFLQKILGSLRRQRLVRSVRGVHGGYALARPSSSITLWQVFRALDPDPYLDGCLLACGRCESRERCSLHTNWTGIRRELVDLLQRTSISDVADRPGCRTES